jgi:hypothetical protein
MADFSPRGHLLAVIEQRARESAVVILAPTIEHDRRPIFAGAAPLEDLAWSPDGRWLMATSPRADQWLFLRGRPPNDVIARSGVARQLDPGHRVAEFPRLSGWCCAP